MKFPVSNTEYKVSYRGHYKLDDIEHVSTWSEEIYVDCMTDKSALEELDDNASGTLSINCKPF